MTAEPRYDDSPGLPPGARHVTRDAPHPETIARVSTTPDGLPLITIDTRREDTP